MEDGLEGVGETLRGRPTAAIIGAVAPQLIGLDARKIEVLLQRVRMLPFFYGYVGFAAIAGIEMACWDLLGKVSNQSVATLLGGEVRSTIPIGGLVFKKPQHSKLKGRDLADTLTEDARFLVSQQKVGAVKLKGSHDPEQDVLNMEPLEEEFQGAVKLRVDPNAASRQHVNVLS